MKSFRKSLLASAILAAGATGFGTAHAVEWSLGGEIGVELTDADANNDLGLAVTTTDLLLTVTEKYGDVTVEGYIAYEKGDLAGSAELVPDGRGITVSGGFGSVFVGDDGTGVFAGDITDVMYNNSEIFFADPTTNVIDYGLPLDGPFKLNVFVDMTSGDSEDIDAVGAYGSYAMGGLTFLLGFTTIEENGAYGGGTGDILDFAIGYEGGPIKAGFGFQDQDTAADEIISAFLTYTTGAIAITPYIEDAGNAGDVTALNVSYSFTENHYMFFETATYDNKTNDNTSIGLVLTF
jgi:hypothetical protein